MGKRKLQKIKVRLKKEMERQCLVDVETDINPAMICRANYKGDGMEVFETSFVANQIEAGALVLVKAKSKEQRAKGKERRAKSGKKKKKEAGYRRPETVNDKKEPEASDIVDEFAVDIEEGLDL